MFKLCVIKITLLSVCVPLKSDAPINATMLLCAPTCCKTWNSVTMSLMSSSEGISWVSESVRERERDRQTDRDRDRY